MNEYRMWLWIFAVVFPMICLCVGVIAALCVNTWRGLELSSFGVCFFVAFIGVMFWSPIYAISIGIMIITWVLVTR